jgi:hypothetical protein
MSALLYLERLGDQDLALLARWAGGRGALTERVAELRAEPGRIEELLARPETFAALFERGREEPFVAASPFLVFSVLLARVSAELQRATHVPEWVGPGRRIPLLDVAALGDFVADTRRRVFLADLLASYTHVVSGAVWVRSGRRWRRRRWSELDPVRLAELAEVVPEPERPAVYRRLGDLALFLTGVFPDHTGGRLFRPVQLERVVRALRAARGEVDGAAEPDELGGAIAAVERVGRASYLITWRAIGRPESGPARVLVEVAERFGDARRVLNFLTDRYLFPIREHWFGGPAA